MTLLVCGIGEREDRPFLGEKQLHTPFAFVVKQGKAQTIFDAERQAHPLLIKEGESLVADRAPQLAALVIEADFGP
jgi:hypothetical protein